MSGAHPALCALQQDGQHSQKVSSHAWTAALGACGSTRRSEPTRYVYVPLGPCIQVLHATQDGRHHVSLASSEAGWQPLRGARPPENKRGSRKSCQPQGCRIRQVRDPLIRDPNVFAGHRQMGPRADAGCRPVRAQVHGSRRNHPGSTRREAPTGIHWGGAVVEGMLDISRVFGLVDRHDNYIKLKREAKLLAGVTGPSASVLLA
jgi:hypothetical protein